MWGGAVGDRRDGALQAQKIRASTSTEAFVNIQCALCPLPEDSRDCKHLPPRSVSPLCLLRKPLFQPFLFCDSFLFCFV